MMPYEDNSNASAGSLGRGIDSLINREESAPSPKKTAGTTEGSSMAFAPVAKLVGAAAAGTVAVAACTLVGVKAVLAMQLHGGK